MKNVNEQKIKLEQKKNRLILEENRLKTKERKMRTRLLIEIGGLVTKAELDYLPTSTLYGALLSLSAELEANPKVKDRWTELGKNKFDHEQQSRTAVILKFTEQPSSDIRSSIRSCGLKWNPLRSEWYGYCSDLNLLKETIKPLPHEIEMF